MTAPPELVSVIVPCFNGARWLGEAIDSALAQTWPAVEVVVVDDGSRDDSVEVARAFGERVTVLTGPNQGPAAARNRGIAAARGARVQFLDADDLLLPRKIEDCMAAIAGPDDVPFSGLVVFGEDAGEPGLRARVARALAARLAEPTPPFDPTRPIETILTHPIEMNRSLYPMDRLRRLGGFRAELRWLEDIDLNLRLVLDGARYVPLHTPLALVRDHAQPGRQRHEPGAARGRIEGERAMMAAVRAAERWSDGVARVFADRLAYAGRQALLAGEADAGREALALARSLHPRPRATRIPVYNQIAGVLGVERTDRLLRLRSPVGFR